jgi:hypothetical protein
MSHYNKLAQDLNVFIERLIMDPVLLERYRDKPNIVFAEFGITDEKAKMAMIEGGFDNILPLDIHPILAMHYQLVRNPEVASHMTIRYYPELTGQPAEKSA